MTPTKTRPTAGHPNQTNKLGRAAVLRLAEATSDADSYDTYGPSAWRGCAIVLARRGYGPRAIEAILRSKWTRWAADGARNPRQPTSADLIRFMDSGRSAARLAQDVTELVRETFGEEHESNVDALPVCTRLRVQAACPVCRFDINPIPFANLHDERPQVVAPDVYDPSYNNDEGAFVTRCDSCGADFVVTRGLVEDVQHAALVLKGEA